MKFVFRVNGQSSLGNEVVSEQYVVNTPGLVGVALFYSWFYSSNCGRRVKTTYLFISGLVFLLILCRTENLIIQSASENVLIHLFIYLFICLNLYLPLVYKSSRS